GIHFIKNYRKNDQEGIDGNSDALIILVLSNMDGKNACRSLMKDICIAVRIDINGHNIVNHSGCSTPITFLFQKKPSNQQREDALSLLINNIGLVTLNNSEMNLCSISSSLKDSSKINFLSHSRQSYSEPSHPELMHSGLSCSGPSELSHSEKLEPSHLGTSEPSPKYDGLDVPECDNSDISKYDGPDGPEQDGSKYISSGYGGSKYDCLECDWKFIFDESFKGNRNKAKTKD
ncbi:24292_t:CDS:2, partial [Cetraspora pellucida]